MAGKPVKTLRQRVRELMDPHEGHKEPSRAGVAINLCVLACILASLALILVEHLHRGTPGLSELLWAAEVLFTALFTVEYLLRWYGAEDRLSYPLGFFAVIDLLAIVPSYVMLAHALDIAPDFLALRLVRVSRILRLLRLFRLLKFVRHGHLLYRTAVAIRIWAAAVRHQYHLDRLMRLLSWTVLAWVAGTNLLWLTERFLADGTGPYDGYWPSYWNVVVVLVSGMDAEKPVTVPGMIEVVILLVVGICMVGMLTGEIVAIIVRSAERRGKLPLKPPDLRMENHFVVLGRNRHLTNVIRQSLSALSGPHHVLVVATDADQVDQVPGIPAKRVMAMAADPSRAEVLEEACVTSALRVVILSSDCGDEPCSDRDNRALMYALAVAARNRETPLVVELQEEESLRYAAALPSAECIVRHRFGEKLIGQAVLHPGVTSVYRELMTFSGDTNEFYVVDAPRDMVGRTFADVQRHFLEKDDEAILVVGIDWSSGNNRYVRYMLHPAGGAAHGHARHVIGPGDRLIVMAYEMPSFAQVTQEDLWSKTTMARS